MSVDIAKDTKVKVTGLSSTEYGTEGVVKDIRPGWTGPEVIVEVRGLLRTRTVTVPISDLSKV